MRATRPPGVLSPLGRLYRMFDKLAADIRLYVRISVEWDFERQGDNSRVTHAPAFACYHLVDGS